MKLFKGITLLIAVASIMLLSAGLASAGPFDPAYRGAENSVHAIFDLQVNNNPPTIEIDWQTSSFDTGPSIYDLDPTQPLAVDEGPNTVIELPNFVDPLPLKLMRIQMFFGTPVLVDPFALAILAFDPEPTNWNVVGGSGAGEASEHYIDIEIWPNPDSEQITLFGAAVRGIFLPGQTSIDGVIGLEVDTVSLPEPASLTLLVLGGLALLRRKRVG